VFHTSSQEVWNWINRFGGFTNYRHRVFSRHRGRTDTMPINLMTLNNFFGLNLDPQKARAFLAEEVAREPFPNPRNFEEKAISLMGRRLYEAFIRGYTAKQWETDPKLLPAEIITRLPMRTSFTDFYFDDLFEGLPIGGYHGIFARLFDEPLIQTVTGCDFFEARPALNPDAIIVYTGPVDRYFEYCFGPLNWRTLDFELDRPPVEDFQGAAVVNYPDPDVRWTRIHEFRHLHPERRYRKDRTLIMREYSRFARGGDEPYYPVNTPEDRGRYDRYVALAAAEQRVIFGGRLGTYSYLDMHQAIGAALRAFERELRPMIEAGNATRQKRVRRRLESEAVAVGQ
jgi:UDP-galactopyranose mutase